MLTRLTDDHSRIRAIVADLEIYLDADRAPVDPDFPRRRWELMRQLSTHLAVERHAIATRLAGGPDVTRGLDTALDGALRAFMLEWTVTRIEREWLSYRAATRALLRRLGKRMAHEEAMVFPLLARA